MVKKRECYLRETYLAILARIDFIQFIIIKVMIQNNFSNRVRNLVVKKTKVQDQGILVISIATNLWQLLEFF